ncbi:MAG: hypothetical protein PHN44_02600, partial [Candidatus Marinimicrobia bacterium]|nr:hypothetical protein [Candidatus Neomarinimicrobiota bacterium]
DPDSLLCLVEPGSRENESVAPKKKGLSRTVFDIRASGNFTRSVLLLFLFFLILNIHFSNFWHV